jgi:hypothetical protein
MIDFERIKPMLKTSLTPFLVGVTFLVVVGGSLLFPATAGLYAAAAHAVFAAFVHPFPHCIPVLPGCI